MGSGRGVAKRLNISSRPAADSERTTRSATAPYEALRVSEARFRDLVEGSIQGIIVHRHFKPLFANQAAADIFGVAGPTDILARGSIVEFYAPHERERLKGYKDARMRGEPAPASYEYQGVRADSTLIWLENRVSVVDWDGAPANLTTYFDITERKRAQAALRESEERFRDFAESATDWLWEMDANLRFSYFSDRFEEGTGISPEIMLGRTRRELLEAGQANFNNSNSKAKWDEYFAIIEGRQPFRDFRPPSRRDDGLTSFISLSGKPVFDESGNFKGYRGTGVNIADQVEAEVSLRRREAELLLHRDRAEEANRAKSEFLANVSHELRTPLNAIIGFSDMMSQRILGHTDPEKYLGYAKNIHDSATHLLRLITDILDISTVDAGRYVLDVEGVEFSALADACCKSVADEVADGAIELIVDLDDDLPVFPADRRAVQSMLLHLLSNAIEFTPKGGQVSVRAQADKEWFSITVEDTGVGISEEDLPKLTDPFEQGRRDPYRSEERTGLGLAVTLSMVKLHNGKMEMSSTVGAGTCVTIRLPLVTI
ncbi:MAG: PAS domain S-box protein [Alphaproteobacteria bacterium]|nr:PAS domain S-box protein [Alphaproteobacteria bacterium]